jgi:hypothetical protein
MPSSDRGDELNEQEVPLMAGSSSGSAGDRRRRTAGSSSAGLVEMSNGRRKPLKATEKMW